ncbi:small nuclear ribonucleoprotein G, partial [Cyanistes caeruleus]
KFALFPFSSPHKWLVLHPSHSPPPAGPAPPEPQIWGQTLPFWDCQSLTRRVPAVKLNGGRHVQGILRGFDPFMNLVIDECVEMAPGGQQNNIGMVVIRGNSIIMLEALERV